MITSLNITVFWICRLTFDINEKQTELNTLKWTDLIKKNRLFVEDEINVTMYVNVWNNIASWKAFTIIKSAKITYFANCFIRFVQSDAETVIKYRLSTLII